jgi:hypothetical protein
MTYPNNTSIVMLSVVMLNVIMPSVTRPLWTLTVLRLPPMLWQHSTKWCHFVTYDVTWQCHNFRANSLCHLLCDITITALEMKMSSLVWLHNKDIMSQALQWQAMSTFVWQHCVKSLPGNERLCNLWPGWPDWAIFHQLGYFFVGSVWFFE